MTSAFAYPQSREAYLWLSFLTYTVRLLGVFIPVHLARHLCHHRNAPDPKMYELVRRTRPLDLRDYLDFRRCLGRSGSLPHRSSLVGQGSAGPLVNQCRTTELLQLKADVAQQQARAANADARLPHAEPMPTTAIGIWLSTRVQKPKGRVNQYYCDAVLRSKLLFELSSM